MATKQIGKLKLHWSKRGIAYKWGDGEIHRLSFERKQPEDSYGYDQYAQDSYAPDQGGYVPQEQGYDGQPYEGAYDSPQGDYQGEYYPDQPYDGGRYAFLYTNDWLMYALLVLLPPLGIWILIKRERFTPIVRAIVAAASGIWFIVLLVWLFSALLGGGQDAIQTPPTVQTPPAVTTTQPEVSDVSSDDGLDITAPAAATPLPSAGSDTTPLGNATVPASGVSVPSSGGDSTTVSVSSKPSSASISASDYCYSAGTSAYFHSSQDCPDIEDNASRTQVSLARSRSQTACPTCYDTTSVASATAISGNSDSVIYATKKGKYYHTDQTCGNMTGATVYTLAQAKKEGKTSCPTCIGKYYMTAAGKYYHTDRNCSGMSGAKLTTAAAAEAAGKTKCPTCLKNAQAAKSGTVSASKTYYSTSKGKYYHTNKTCGGMKGASKVTASIIKKRGQTPCPVCISAKTTTTSSGQYFATRTGTYYHTKSNCSGMSGATKITLTTAKKYGKKACPVCVAAQKITSATYYATSSGTYYHKDSTCSGMKGAKKVTKATAEKNGKKPCPDCLKDMSVNVYATTGGKYYHKTSSCSGMKNAKKVTLASAKASGKTACPDCYKAAAAKDAVYYATTAGKYYHVKDNCSGMKNASKVSLATAKARGKTACPTCLGDSSTTYYYATSKGEYYHKKSNCSGMSGASKITLAAALKASKDPCPVCVKKVSATPTPAPITGTYCYASTGSKYYHRVMGCSGLKNLQKVLLTTAKSKGKTACPVCVTKKVDPTRLTTNYADKQTTCYASTASAYYHAKKDCVTGLSKTTVAAAKNKGRTACPTCAGNLNTYVYVTRSGTKYHRKSNCAGTSNTYKISLDTALDMNYVRCTKCNAPKKS